MPEDPLVGLELGGYRLEERIARGGMGAVYRGLQLSLERTVAIKVMHSNPLTRERRAVERMFREARCAARINHENIVQVLDAGLEHDLVFIVMELVLGRDLKRIVKEDGPLGVGSLLEIMVGATQGLCRAHETDMIHRDMKPDNIMLAIDGTVKVADFGLVTFSGATSLTVSGLIVGTPDYMSPETCRGEDVDARADLYGLGATMFFGLAGEPPFRSKSKKDVTAVLMKHVFEMPKEPAALRDDVPKDVSDLILRLLAKDPKDRPPDAKALLEELCELKERYPAEQDLQTLAQPKAAPPPAEGESAGGSRTVPPRTGPLARGAEEDPAAAPASPNRSGDTQGTTPAPNDTAARTAVDVEATPSPGEANDPAARPRVTETVPDLPAPPPLTIKSGARPPSATSGTAPSRRLPVPPGSTRPDLSPTRGGVLPDAAQLTPRELLLRAKLHLAAERYEAASDDLRRVVEAEPASLAAHLGLVRALSRQPERAREAGDAAASALGAPGADEDLVRRALRGSPLEDDEAIRAALASGPVPG